ncbi:hypothetical protein TPHV1_300022 [Treponema phagedenis]|uniref:Uncharacterized protein n=1 Tax=Treponema phagedenis TaxID=162 RepID=A0A0B7H0B9_TREPH|nr:hypothetical protein TPHV1_300022 [Treponema phagedenis]
MHVLLVCIRVSSKILKFTNLQTTGCGVDLASCMQYMSEKAFITMVSLLTVAT